MKIYANTIVRNDEKWLWFSVTSVIDYVDKILLWDTGSTDKTLEIIEELKKEYPDKIFFKEAGRADPHEFSLFRQEMLDVSDCDWIIVLDSDEIWPKDSIKELITIANKNEADVIVAPFLNLVGDIYHFQDINAGRYLIDKKKGNFTVKAFKRDIKGVTVSKDYGSEGYVDASEKFIQESNLIKREFIKGNFLHATHLSRSSEDKNTMGRKGKVKYELGNSFPADYYYPEVFFRPRPSIVESPWESMDPKFKFISYLETPLRKLKRRIWWGKAGY